MPNSGIWINLTEQSLSVHSPKISRTYPVSTGQNGSGQASGSGCTPLGPHIIRARIGSGAPSNAVFVGRRFTREIYTEQLAEQYPDRDWILSRIIWLSGTQIGYNRLGNVDSMRRYIYIHGTPETEPMGTAKSHGCIRMRNHDLIELFDLVAVGTSVMISL